MIGLLVNTGIERDNNRSGTGSQVKVKTRCDSRASSKCFQICMLPRTDDPTVFLLLAEAAGGGKGGRRVFIWPSKVLEEKDGAQTFRIYKGSLRSRSALALLGLLEPHASEAASLHASEVQKKRLR